MLYPLDESTNVRALSSASNCSSVGGALEQLNCCEEDNCHHARPNNGNENKDLRVAESNRHVDDIGKENGELDCILNHAAASFDRAPAVNAGIDSVLARYNPVRKHQSGRPQSQYLQERNKHPTQRSMSELVRPPRVMARRRSSTNQRVLQNDLNNRESFEIKQNAIHSLQTDGTLEHISAMDRLQVEERWNESQDFWRRLAIRASPADTSHKELVKRSTFLVISTMTVGAGVLWGFMYVALNEWLAALMPFIYSTSMSVILFTCICRDGAKGYDAFVECQLTLILVLPFAVHVALGGVEKSGGVMLWSFLCPMGAAFFRNSKESLRWFWIYLSISGLLLVAEFWNASAVELIEESVTTIKLVSGSPSTPSSSSATIQKLYFLMNIIGVKCVIFAAVFLFARELEKEYTKSEEVLLNILPSSIVKRVKRGEFPIVDHVAGVTILFADLVGFTKASTELHPNFLIGLFLRDIFHEFDVLVYEHGLEKIKTIGDAYMVVGGLNHGETPSQRSRSRAANYGGQKPHATNTMLLAVDMFKALQRVNLKYNLKFELRIGAHTGPVVAGVLGLKRFTYDVWGDAVNTASRMESNGVPSLIHLSSEMHRAVDGMSDIFDFSCCGKIEIKGKGEMTTYLAKPW